MRFSLFILLTLTLMLAQSQPSAFNLQQLGKGGNNIITGNALYLEDVTDTMGVTTIAQLPTSAFKQAPDKLFVGFGRPKHIIWFRFIVANQISSPTPFLLGLANHLAYEFNLWQNVDGNITYVASTGRKYKFGERPYESSYLLFPCIAKASKQTTYYLRADSRGIAFTMGLMAFNNNTIKRLERALYFGVGTFSGVLILVFLFSFYLFLVTKEKIHFYYMLYILFQWFLLMSLEGYDFEFFYPNLPDLALFARIFFGCWSICLMLVVMRLFIEQTKSNSIFYNPIRISLSIMWFVPLIGLYASLTTGHYLFTSIITACADKGNLIGLLLVLCSCIERIRQGFKLAVFYLLAVSALIVSIIFFIFGVYNRLLYPTLMVEGSAVIEVVIISFGILYRYNQYRKQKEQLEANLLLLKIESAKQIVRAEEEERRRIARDLHDDVSGTLSGLRFFVTNQFKHLKVSGDYEADFRSKLLDTMGKLAQDIRNISHNLMPIDFDKRSLPATINERINFLNEHQSIVFEFICKGTDVNLSLEQKLSVYRCISELLQNVIKHSGASKATVQMLTFDTYIEFQVLDDGSGFNLNDPKKGIGILDVQSRLHLLNGEFSIDSNPFGTTVIFTIPFIILKKL